VTADVQDFTENLGYFGQGVPDYVKNAGSAAERTSSRLMPRLRDRLKQRAIGVERDPPAGLVAWLQDRLKQRATGLERDIDVTTRNISASAGLRQAIAGTRLQRIVLWLTIIATVIAIISLIVAIRAGQTAQTPGAKSGQPSSTTSRSPAARPASKLPRSASRHQDRPVGRRNSVARESRPDQ
jgi:hypothetical protein